MSKAHDRAAVTRGRRRPLAPEQRAVALRDMELTVEEAKELQERIEHPTAFPKRPPRDLPPGDDSMLRRR